MKIIEKLRQYNLRPTKQRIALGKLLLDGKNRHFTAELVQKEISNKGHDISLATVYNCLNKFVDVGLIKLVETQGEVSIFDTNINYHHHFIDEETGELIDINQNEIKFLKIPKSPEGYNQSGLEVLIKIKKSSLE